MSGIPTIVTLDEPLSALAVPDAELKKQALAKVKEALDPLSEQYSVLDQIHVQDMDAEMVWAQAKMVIDGVVDKLIGEVFPKYGKIQPEEDEEESGDESQYESAQEEVEDVVEEEEEEEDGVDAFDDADEDDEDEEEEDNENSDSDIDMENLVDDYQEDEEEAEEDDDNEELSNSDGEEKPDKFGLNDGFFNIDKFNQQIMAMEADNFGENGPDFDWNKELDEQSDDSVDDIKYDDFYGKAKFDKKFQYEQRVAKRQKLAEEKAERVARGEPSEEEESDDGDEDKQEDDDNEADFDMEASENEDDYEDMINSVKKDLFEDEIAEDAPEHLSTFEKQQRDIMKQIAQFEKENVAEKKWTLKGEARAAQRTKDSLLEEDLDFERGAKPVPVITQTVTESLEDMIKARIKSSQFDDLPRRFFDDLPQFKKSKLIEVSEQKSQKSLADLYEAEAMGETDPATTNEPPNEMRDAAHKEIEDLFANLSYTLDALSSWTYKPKPQKSIQIVTNAPAISMEEAQPQALAQEDQLAPQEVYKPEVADKRERLAGSTGMPQTKAEMTREERKRAKKKEKVARGKQLAEKEEKQRALAEYSKEGDAKGSKAQVMETLKQGNVTVIGKRGEKRGLDGKLKKDSKAKDGFSLKL